MIYRYLIDHDEIFELDLWIWISFIECSSWAKWFYFNVDTGLNWTVTGKRKSWTNWVSSVACWRELLVQFTGYTRRFWLQLAVFKGQRLSKHRPVHENHSWHSASWENRRDRMDQPTFNEKPQKGFEAGSRFWVQQYCVAISSPSKGSCFQ